MTQSNSPQVDPDKIQIIGIKLLSSKYETSQEFLKNPQPPAMTNVQIGHSPGVDLPNNVYVLKLEFILTGLNDTEEEIGLTASYSIHFAFKVENLNELVTQKDQEANIHKGLATTIISIAFSTARGIILERTQGTFFNGSILPIIRPTELIDHPDISDTGQITIKK